MNCLLGWVTEPSACCTEVPSVVNVLTTVNLISVAAQFGFASCVTLGSACPLWALVFLPVKWTKSKKSLKGNLTQ